MPVVAQHSNRGVYLLGPGTFVHFGPKFEWYVRHDRTVLANSDDAAKYCADLQTAAVWLKPKLEEEEMAATWCTDENIAKARVIDLEMSEVGFGIDVDIDHLPRRKAEAMKRVAKKLGLNVKEAEALYYPVSASCARQMNDRGTTCSDREIEIANAVSEAEFLIDRRGLDGVGLLRKQEAAVRRAA